MNRVACLVCIFSFASVTHVNCEVVEIRREVGKIQGDGRKFLDRFKSYFWSQISSQSLNEIHIYRLQPKREFFS